MKKFGLIASLAVLCACGSPQKPEGHGLTLKESSELALLMRAMFDDAERVLHQVQEGEAPVSKIDHQALLTAEGTEPDKVNSTAYRVFAESYLHLTDQLFNGPDSLREAAYDQWVTGCENCHRSLCPGPLVRIKKLRRLD